MSPRKPFDMNAQTDLLEPSNQLEQFQPPDNLFLQTESLNNNLAQLAPFVDTHQGSEPANNFLGIVGPEESSQTRQKIRVYIDQLRKQVTIERNHYIKGRIDENNVKLVDVTQNLFKLSNERRNCKIADTEQNINLLAKRLKETNDFHCGSSLEQRFAYSKTVIGSVIVDSSQRPIELHQVEKIPKYCTWVCLDRNQTMTEEQTLRNRRRIYYDQDGEICICSNSDTDSDSEKVEEEEKKHFTESVDYILRMTVKEFGLSDLVVKLLAEYFSKKPDDVQARYEYLMKGGNPIDGGSVSDSGVSFEKDLDAALDSFNNLFCRRCLVFDCRLHGCSQELIYSVEKQTQCGSLDAEKGPCGENCHLLACFGKDDDEEERRMDKHNADHDGSWTPLEKSLFETGLLIFGRNSCLIARNVMNDWKTCFETFMYMNSIVNEQSGDGGNVDVCDGNKVVGDESTSKQVQRKSRFWSRKGKVRRLKYKPKSSGYTVFRKRIGAMDRPNPHYTPCGCQSPCGKDCGCAVNMTTCEKYCGCPRSCKNRFRGCHCAKGQCRSRHCPCFAANRECDPDVCKNCWISCGGEGIIGVPAKKGDNYECMNMKLLLKQQLKIVLGKSSVKGWGAFLTCDVGKDEFLGEYTGEVISHYEAEKRGKLYDRIDLSYLFNLDDQSVLDSFGMGDKLKFANHSPNPNCYAKVMLVGGDYRVGIYSKEALKAGDEIFYDYQYQPGVSPPWALSASSSKKKGAHGSKKSAARKRA